MALFSRAYSAMTRLPRVFRLFRRGLAMLPFLERFCRNALHSEAARRHGPVDLPSVVRKRRPSGLAFIYFMGIGDALFTTPLLKACKERWPDLPIHAWVSSTKDMVNSPLVAELLRMDPHVDLVQTYQGRRNGFWQNYDTTDARIPEDFLALPIVWGESGRSRVEQLGAQFGLPMTNEDLRPCVYPPQEPTPNALCLAKQAKELGGRGVVLLHLDTRSSQYVYPWSEELATRLADEGWAVICFTPLKKKVDGVLTAVPENGGFNLRDTVSLLSVLRSLEDKTGFWGVCVQSMLWPLTAAFSIPVLGLNLFHEPLNIGSYVTPNIHLLSAWDYEGTGIRNAFRAVPEEYVSWVSPAGKEIIQYRPEAVCGYFCKANA